MEPPAAQARPDPPETPPTDEKRGDPERASERVMPLYRVAVTLGPQGPTDPVEHEAPGERGRELLATDELWR